ncbi:MAG: hypothetical protein HC853_13365 [Anaerolineae bacterium]|nr:hypothetical protein [Anaerolineae bacterium]
MSARPLLANSATIATTDAEQASLPIVWGLPILVAQTTDKLLDKCVRATFEARRWNTNLTGTLTYASGRNPTYRPTPSDRLRVIGLDGLTLDFWITGLQGHLGAGPSDFLTREYQLKCRTQQSGFGDLTINAKQTSQGLLNRTRITQTKGQWVYEGRRFELDTQANSAIYYESSFDGSEYLNQTKLQGTARDTSLALTLAESFSFQHITSGDESASASRRISDSQWRVDGKRYVLSQGYLNQSFKNGKPARLETEWRAGGTISREGRQWVTLSGKTAKDYFEVWATLPEGRVMLTRIYLNSASVTHALANAISQDQTNARHASIVIGAVLKTNSEERSQLASDIYKLTGLDATQVISLALSTGVDIGLDAEQASQAQPPNENLIMEA